MKRPIFHLTFKRAGGLAGVLLTMLSCMASPFATPTLPPSTPTTVPTAMIPAPTPTAVPIPGVGADGIGDTYYTKLGNGGYDITHYTIKLEVDPPANTINGSTLIEAAATENLDTFNLDLQGLTVDEVKVNGETAQFSRHEDELSITPAQSLQVNASFTIEVRYHGTPERKSPQALSLAIGWSHSTDGAINAWGEPAAAASWFPNNNHPRDKATYRFEITVPDPWIVAANGELRDTIAENGNTAFLWEMDQPMATYLATINIDQYETFSTSGPDGIVIRNYFPEDYPVEERKAYDVIPEVMDFLDDLFGSYPFKQYGVVVASETGMCEEASLALEAQTLSIHCPIMSFEGVIVHELGHQWFGDSVSLENWQDIWLKEGFATYSEWLWETQNDPEAMAQLARDFQSQGFGVRRPIAEPAPDNLYTGASYLGGALVLQALREEVGDETFFQILQSYGERYRYSYAGTDEFMAIAQEVSGQDLNSFFEQWLYSIELPVLP